MTEEHCDGRQLEADLVECVASAEQAGRLVNAAIRRCHAGGLSLRAIAAVTGDSPETVRKIVRAGS